MNLKTDPDSLGKEILVPSTHSHPPGVNSYIWFAFIDSVGCLAGGGVQKKSIDLRS